MSDKLIDYEIDVLRSLSGEKIPGLTGAEVGVAVERLIDEGYVSERLFLGDDGPALKFEITDKGRAAITQETRDE